MLRVSIPEGAGLSRDGTAVGAGLDAGWLGCVVGFTPPYSPAAGKLSCATPSPRAELHPPPPPLVAFPSPSSVVGDNSGAGWARVAPCCRRHRDAPPAAAVDSESSFIHEECVGSRTCGADEPIEEWAVGMTARELDLRVQLGRVQQLHREKQRDLKRLARVIKRRDALRQAQTRPVARAKAGHGTARAGRRNLAPPRPPRLSCPPAVEPPTPTPTLSNAADSAHQTAIDVPGLLVNSAPLSDPPADDFAAFSPPSSSEDTRKELVASPKSSYPADEPTDARTSIGPVSSDAPAVVEAFLRAEDIDGGLRVLILEAGLLYAGTLEVIDGDALLYGVNIDGQRACRPHILCQEELLRDSFREVPFDDVGSSAIEGLRVCAFWSGQLQALYPGTVACTAAQTDKYGDRTITINFDDGDSGQISVRKVRRLPQDFPITKVVSTCLPTFITRRRGSGGGDGAEKQPSVRRRRCRSPAAAADRPLSANGGWQWMDATEYDCRRRRQYFGGVQCDDSTVRVGDLVQLLQPRGGDLFVAVVEAFWETRGGQRRVRVAWCYGADEVPAAAAARVPTWAQSHALFTSRHCDDNSVESVSARCRLLGWRDLDERLSAEPRVYFLAGSFNPTTGKVRWADDFIPAD